MTRQQDTCCDEAGWKLDSNGLPVEPAVKCSRHANKPGPAKPADPAAADAPDTRDGQKHKFEWFYAVMADPTVSIRGKAIGAACVIKWAGRKGHFKATRKAIATLCGTSQATVRRGLADLIDKGFLTADIHEGAASTYYLILPAQRWEKWLDAEKAHHAEIERAERAIRQWLFAENFHREKQFRDAICEASMARGADQGLAQRIGDWLLGKFRERDLDLDIDEGLRWVALQERDTFVVASAGADNPATRTTESDALRADPGTPESRPRPAGEPGSVRLRADPGTPESRPRLTTDASSSGNGQTHKSFKDSERPVKVFQGLESDPALRDALKARPPHGAAQPVEPNGGPCELCDSDGIFRDRYGLPVVLIDDDCHEYPVECRHSMAANLADIQRREKAEELSLCRTGWPEIDSHYPQFDGPDSSDDF